METQTCKLLSLTSFFGRHLFAAVVSVAVPVVLAVVLYFTLLAYAFVAGVHPGGPFAMPFLVLLALLLSTAYTLFLLFPSVCIAEFISRRFGKWRHPIQIPVSTAVLAVLIFLSTLLGRHLAGQPQAPPLGWLGSPLVAFLLLLIPLGLYWWAMKLAELGLFLPAWLFKKLRSVLR